jgi:hypothetical protein
MGGQNSIPKASKIVTTTIERTENFDTYVLFMKEIAMI